MGDFSPWMRCSAHNRAGKQCGKDAIPGAVVCHMHGGKSPQVKEAAKLRLLEMVDPALATMLRMVTKSKIDAVRLQAARDILDRTGFKPTDKVEITEITSKAAVIREQRLKRRGDRTAS